MAVVSSSTPTYVEGASVPSLGAALGSGVTVNVGDLLLACVYVSSTAVDVPSSVPSGWTLVGSGNTTTSGTEISQRLYYKVAVSADTSRPTYTWAWSTAKDRAICLVSVTGQITPTWSTGVNFHGFAGTDSGPSWSVTALGVTDLNPNELYLCFAGISGVAGASISSVAGSGSFAEIGSPSFGTGGAHAALLSYQAGNATPGGTITSTITWTFGSTQNGSGATMMLAIESAVEMVAQTDSNAAPTDTTALAGKIAQTDSNAAPTDTTSLAGTVTGTDSNAAPTDTTALAGTVAQTETNPTPTDSYGIVVYVASSDTNAAPTDTTALAGTVAGTDTNATPTDSYTATLLSAADYLESFDANSGLSDAQAFTGHLAQADSNATPTDSYSIRLVFVPSKPVGPAVSPSPPTNPATPAASSSAVASTTEQSNVTFSIERPRWFALVISSQNGNVYRLTGINGFTTSKDDSGAAGSFSFHMSLINEQYAQMTAPAPGYNGRVVLDYASVAMPMDLVAIYALRETDTTSTPLGPLAQDTFVYSYGDPGATTVTAMGTATCVMIGMVDRAEEMPLDMDGRSTSFEVSGTDLTKVFYHNDAQIPLGEVGGSSDILTNPITLLVNRPNSGTALLLSMLKIIVKKDLSGLQNVKNPPSASTIKALRQYGYDWDFFVRQDALDQSFQHLTGNKYPPLSINAGAAWSNVDEMRNAPVFRLYVNEIGQLIFDKAYDAWTGAKAPAYLGTNGFLTLDSSDIVRFSTSLDDAELLTNLAVIPAAALSAQIAALQQEGLVLTNGLNGLIAVTATNVPAVVKKYGYRYAQFNATWAATPDDIANAQQALVYWHNSLYQGSLLIKGNALVRAGTRVYVPVQTSRADTSYCIWYVQSVRHEADWGQKWTTYCTLRFPQAAAGTLIGSET